MPVFAEENCENEVTIPVPVIDNPCNEDFSVVLEIDGEVKLTQLPENNEPIIEILEVGIHTVKWIITDASGNITVCEQAIIVQDVSLEVDCPDDVSASVDDDELFATGVKTGTPTATAECMDVGDIKFRWELTPPVDFQDEYLNPGDVAGNGIYDIEKFYVGVTTITYYLTDEEGEAILDENGDPISCSFTVTIDTEPEINCPEDIEEEADEDCAYEVEPGVPTLISGSHPLVWEYTIVWANDDPDTHVVYDENTEPVYGPPQIGTQTFPIGVTTITWKVTDRFGKTDECTQTITVEDKTPPIFTGTITDFEECVDMLYGAVYDSSSDDVKRYLDHNGASPQPYPIDNGPPEDFFLLMQGNTDLDLDWNDFKENCCDITESNILWTITFDLATPNGRGGTTISGTEQPSTHYEDIKLWGDRIGYQTLTHTIEYTITGCNGNEMKEPIIRNITILPRPQIIKMTGP